MSRWTTQDIPDLSERIAVVTGANAGLGLETARVLCAYELHHRLQAARLWRLSEQLTDVSYTIG
ncbi:hypothetical protein [Kribbella sp. NPDC004536]|uniref:hypothetical protein n=1 Tax=Kribbella sp. NPDC004536 TaxID=3364106 RepID=UPI0036A1532D